MTSPANTIKAVIKATGVSVEELEGPSRTQRIADARAVAMTALRRTTRMTLIEIALAFRRGDHTTVKAAIKKVEREPMLTIVLDHVLRQATSHGD